MSEKQLPLDPLQAKGRLRITQHQQNSALSTAKKWGLSDGGDSGLHSALPAQPKCPNGSEARKSRQAGEPELRWAVWRGDVNTSPFSTALHPQHFRDIHSTSTLQTTEVISAQVEMGK